MQEIKFEGFGTPEKQEWADGGMPTEAWRLLEALLDGEEITGNLASRLGVPRNKLLRWSEHPNFLQHLLENGASPNAFKLDALKILRALRKDATAGTSTSVQAARAWSAMMEQIVPGGVAGLFKGQIKDQEKLDLSNMSNEEIAEELARQGMSGN